MISNDSWFNTNPIYSGVTKWKILQAAFPNSTHQHQISMFVQLTDKRICQTLRSIANNRCAWCRYTRKLDTWM